MAVGTVLGATIKNLSMSPVSLLEGASIGTITLALVGLLTKIWFASTRQFKEMLDLVQENTKLVVHHKDGISDLGIATRENTRAINEMRVAIEKFLGYHRGKETSIEEHQGEAGPLTKEELNEQS